MPEPSPTPLRRRAARPADEPFLRRVHAQSRPDLAQLPEPARGRILELQWTAQRHQYRTDAPGSSEQVIELDGVPIGRCWVSTGPGAHRLLDLAIALPYRRHGHGTRVLRELQAGAGGAGVPLRLRAWAANDGALRLYRRLGFATVGGPDGHGDGYVELHWLPGGHRG